MGLLKGNHGGIVCPLATISEEVCRVGTIAVTIYDHDDIIEQERKLRG